GVKVIHPGDKLKYKKAHMEQYIPGWLLFTPKNIQKQYNIDPTKAQPGHRGDHTYADKIRFTYALIVADESK
ncbi:LysM peptidoglycan-binding domain-containing protein, partial [Salmonella enterica]|nr:LysM peptidoglycan-binding domain-containing protein [Salmonella enterica]